MLVDRNTQIHPTCPFGQYLWILSWFQAFVKLYPKHSHRVMERQVMRKCRVMQAKDFLNKNLDDLLDCFIKEYEAARAKSDM